MFRFTTLSSSARRVQLLRRAISPVTMLILFALVLSACSAPQPTPTPQAAQTTIPNSPVIAESTAIAPPPGGAQAQGNTGVSSLTSLGDVSTWKTTQNTLGNITYSYRYPPGWGADLSYCAPGAARTASGNELPARCAATDILVGQKAKDVGPLTGQNITLNGKQAVKQINANLRNGQASRIYTVMVFDATGVPLMGFTTAIGPATDQATQTSITATLDAVASTLLVSKK